MIYFYLMELSFHFYCRNGFKENYITIQDRMLFDSLLFVIFSGDAVSADPALCPPRPCSQKHPCCQWVARENRRFWADQGYSLWQGVLPRHTAWREPHLLVHFSFSKADILIKKLKEHAHISKHERLEMFGIGPVMNNTIVGLRLLSKVCLALFYTAQRKKYVNTSFYLALDCHVEEFSFHCSLSAPALLSINGNTSTRHTFLWGYCGRCNKNEFNSHFPYRNIHLLAIMSHLKALKLTQ